MKKCSGCGQVKPRTDFYSDKRCADGLRSACKECQIARNIRANKRNPEVGRAATRRWYKANAERARTGNIKRWRERMADPAERERHRARSNAWYHANKHRIVIQRNLPPLDAESRDYAAILRGDPCCYCGESMQDIDHIVPVRGGGENHWTNLTAACAACNGTKYSHPLLAFLLTSSSPAVAEAA